MRDSASPNSCCLRIVSHCDCRFAISHYLRKNRHFLHFRLQHVCKTRHLPMLGRKRSKRCEQGGYRLPGRRAGCRVQSASRLVLHPRNTGGKTFKRRCVKTAYFLWGLSGKTIPNTANKWPSTRTTINMNAGEVFADLQKIKFFIRRTKHATHRLPHGRRRMPVRRALPQGGCPATSKPSIQPALRQASSTRRLSRRNSSARQAREPGSSRCSLRLVFFGFTHSRKLQEGRFVK
jgi:hypothetical protein